MFKVTAQGKVWLKPLESTAKKSWQMVVQLNELPDKEFPMA